MRTRHHSVLLHGEQIGSLHHHDDEVAFRFTDQYWQDGDRNVLGLWFEDKRLSVSRSNSVLPVWFSNLLPEGILRTWIAQDRGVSVAREMELLLEVGHDLPGAVQVVQDEGNPYSLDANSAISPRRNSDSPASRWKFSLAGVGLKFSMLKVGERLTIPSGGELGDWIIKLPDANHPRVPGNEFFCMSLAKKVGISVPEFMLVMRDELPHLPDNAWPSGETEAFAIQRFDRTVDRKSIHIEDFAQVRGFYPSDKYLGSFETVAALSYRGSDLSSLLQFVRRLVFNVLIGNGDAHLKNWSLIYRDGRRPALSPAYDLVSTAGYRDAGDLEDLGLKFAGSRRFEALTRQGLERLERLLEVDKGLLVNEARATADIFRREWALCYPDLRDLPFIETWIGPRLDDTIRRLGD